MGVILNEENMGGSIDNNGDNMEQIKSLKDKRVHLINKAFVLMQEGESWEKKRKLILDEINVIPDTTFNRFSEPQLVIIDHLQTMDDFRVMVIRDVQGGFDYTPQDKNYIHTVGFEIFETNELFTKAEPKDRGDLHPYPMLIDVRMAEQIILLMAGRVKEVSKTEVKEMVK